MNNLPLKPPSAFLTPLLELRDYYARLVKEYEILYSEARSQLHHVDALLSNWTSASDLPDKLTAFEPLHEISAAQDASLSESDVNSLDSSQSEVIDTEDIRDTPTPTKSPVNPDKSSKVVPDIPMLPEYQTQSRMEAIKNLLQEHLGTVCHIDFIVRSLYGDLEPHVFKVVKGRVQSSLTQGRERQVWWGIPDEPGCYTLDLSLVTSNKTKGYSQTGNKKKKSIPIPSTNVVPMLEEFEGLFLIDALSDFLEKNSGRVFSVGEIIEGIYGELDEEEIREVKSKVLNELSRGYRTGRFSRVPDKIGFYTWDSQLMLEAGRGR
jgi:hypothetical protein